MLQTLSRPELAAIIGTTHRRVQFRWLRERGWPHEVSYDGYPVVLKSLALKKLGGESEPDQAFSLDEANVNNFG